MHSINGISEFDDFPIYFYARGVYQRFRFLSVDSTPELKAWTYAQRDAQMDFSSAIFHQFHQLFWIWAVFVSEMRTELSWHASDCDQLDVGFRLVIFWLADNGQVLLGGVLDLLLLLRPHNALIVAWYSWTLLLDIHQVVIWNNGSYIAVQIATLINTTSVVYWVYTSASCQACLDSIPFILSTNAHKPAKCAIIRCRDLGIARIVDQYTQINQVRNSAHQPRSASSSSSQRINMIANNGHHCVLLLLFWGRSEHRSAAATDVLNMYALEWILALIDRHVIGMHIV